MKSGSCISMKPLQFLMLFTFFVGLSVLVEFFYYEISLRIKEVAFDFVLHGVVLIFHVILVFHT